LYNIWFKKSKVVIRNKNKVFVLKSKNIYTNIPLKNKKAFIDTTDITVHQRPKEYTFMLEKFIAQIDYVIEFKNDYVIEIYNLQKATYYENLIKENLNVYN
jgi:hypothetical protein